MAYGPTNEDRLPTAVVTARKLIETAPHVAYGTAEMNSIIETAFKEVIHELAVKGNPQSPQFHTVLPVLEALGALTIERNPDTARYSSAAYSATDRFSVSHICHDPFTSTVAPLSVELSSDSSYTDGYREGYRHGHQDGFQAGFKA